MSAAGQGNAVEADASASHDAYSWYTLGVLVLAYSLAFIDRHILSLLVEPLQRDLGVSDTQLSLLHGLAFAAFMALGGLPAGRQIDGGRRVPLVAAGIAVWSLMTAACALTRSFAGLLVCRMGVGVGESVLTPAAYSLLGDRFSPRRLGLALGLYSCGIYIGGGLSLAVGAWLIDWLDPLAVQLPWFGEIRSWQLVFLAVGLPGLPMALWVASLREPRRRHGEGGSRRPSLAELGRYLRGNAAALAGVGLCMSFAAMMNYATNAWVPSFLMRQHGWSVAEAGRAYGALVMLFGVAGVILGGWLSDASAARGVRGGRLAVMAAAAFAAIPFIAAAPHAGDARVALGLLAAATLFVTMVIGSGPAALQALVPHRMRGTVSAMAVLLVNVLGLGIGPTAVALISDYAYVDPLRIGEALGLAASAMLIGSALIGVAGLRAYTEASAARAAPG